MRVAKQGYPFIFASIGAGALFLVGAQFLETSWPAWVAALAFLNAAYCAYFFRDPKRTIPQNDNYILSPADGKILEIVQTEDSGNRVWLVRIFLSVFDPHLQRAPMTGHVKTVKYTEGKFLDARHPQAHFENEQSRLELDARVPITVTQIAGLIARRIVCWVKPGEGLAAGQQYGLIRFGSQVDLTFPVTAKMRAKVGERVLAGETVLAEVE
jgi:phosphatidylserine decarboxylase